jgi:RimJ/RimL family protein N-acetyltransferase
VLNHQNHAPTLETERLIMRPPRAEDFEPWAAFAADPAVTEFIGGPQSRAMAWRNICTIAGAWMINGFSMFSVIEKASGRWVGRLGPWRPEGWPGADVACALVRDVWNKGYAVEGMTAAIDWVFDTVGWTAIRYTPDPGNVRAKKLIARLGARSLGERRVLPEPFNSPVEIWSLTREEWRARPGR